MNNVYWFKGKTVSHIDFSFTQWGNMLPISFQKITEIHYISHRKGLPEELSLPQAKSWLEKQKPQPIQIKIDEETAHSTPTEIAQQAPSMMEAFLTAKTKLRNNLSFIFIAANSTTISYLTLEKI
jgi:hypothetical protein